MTEARLNELEIKLSFQDELIDVLNQQISGQELRLLTLERRLQTLAEAYLNLDSASVGTSASAKLEVPPHY
jgi:SlyX protein